MKKSNIITIILVIIGIQFSFSQVKDENIGSEVVNIVKPYTPTISDAFKVKEIPSLTDEDDHKKETIQYNIFSFPVASTFTPSKGTAASVDPQEKEKLFNNYATLGFGNYETANAELFITKNISRTSYFGAMLRHLSSQGGIKKIDLDDNYYNTNLDLTYGVRERNLSWNVDLGLKNQIYNWYGLPKYTLFDDALINSIDSKQTYNTIALGGKIALKESVFNEASIQFKRFTDGFDSVENRFFVKPTLDFSVLNQKINTDFVVDYVGGSFERRLQQLNSKYNYSSLNLGFSPSIFYRKDDLSIQIGASIFYANSKLDQQNESSVFIYPNIKASYKVVGDI